MAAEDLSIPDRDAELPDLLEPSELAARPAESDAPDHAQPELAQPGPVSPAPYRWQSQPESWAEEYHRTRAHSAPEALFVA